MGPVCVKRNRTNSCCTSPVAFIVFTKTVIVAFTLLRAALQLQKNSLIRSSLNIKPHEELLYTFSLRNASRERINDVWINDRVNTEQMNWIHYFYCRSFICSAQLQNTHLWPNRIPSMPFYCSVWSLDWTRKSMENQIAENSFVPWFLLFIYSYRKNM